MMVQATAVKHVQQGFWAFLALRTASRPQKQQRLHLRKPPRAVLRTLRWMKVPASQSRKQLKF